MRIMRPCRDRRRKRRISSSAPPYTYIHSLERTANPASVTITSPEFQSKMQPARHRMVYALLKEEMSQEGGIHALQLRTRTPEEEQREKERKNQA